MTTREDATEEVDALGLLCPLPILRARDAARRLPAGGRLILWADDERIVRDLPAWCAAQGHALASLRRRRHAGGSDAWRGEILLRPAPG